MQLQRLTYVHGGDPGTLGQLIDEIRGTLRFGEGSGLIELTGEALRRSGATPLGAAAGETSVPVSATSFGALGSDLQRVVGVENVPCILGQAEFETLVLVPPRALGRWTGSLSDLRGKIRYGLAKVGWSL